MDESGDEASREDVSRGTSKWPGFPHWRWDEVPPLAPCRRPQCRQVVRWKPGAHSFGNDDDQDLFCSDVCWKSFWDAHDHWQSTITDLMTSRAREPEFWQGRGDAWGEQFDVCWWQLARYVGVRRGTTKPHVAKWHALYFEVGRAIARAAETEGLLESLLGMLRPEDEPGTHRGKNAGKTLAGLRANASRWPHVEHQILALCDAAEEGQRKRNWLVHSEVVPSEDGLYAALAKPSSGRPRAEIERFKVEQINRIAARFVWVSQAITYVLNTDEDGNVAFVDPLGPPPPVDFDWSPSTTP